MTATSRRSELEQDRGGEKEEKKKKKEGRMDVGAKSLDDGRGGDGRR